MHSIMKPSLIALLVLSSQAQAAGFQLAEQSATGMGRAFAGEAAIADNASVLSRNAAAMTRFERTAFSGGVIHIQPDVNIEGVTRVPTTQGPVTLDASANDIADGAWVPNAYLILPLNDQWWLGLAATSYYGLGVQMPDNYNAGHFGNVSDIKTVDLGASLAYRINRNWSVGAGLSAIQGEGEVGGTFPSNNKIAKHLKGDGWALGWHLGTLLELSPATRIGLSYRHDVTLTLSGVAVGTDLLGHMQPRQNREFALRAPACTPLEILHPVWMMAFLILISVTFSLFGFIIGIWANGFEQLQMIPMLVVTPLTFLGGSFYSIDMLPPVWRTITLFNPVVYLISGFRWTFYGAGDVAIGISVAATLGFFALCLGVVMWMFKTGYRLKA